jgi:hypothetical protein
MHSYTGSAQALAFHGRLGPRERRRLLMTLDLMAAHPPVGEPSGIRDETGRELRIYRDDGFEFLFWDDHLAGAADCGNRFRAEVSYSDRSAVSGSTFVARSAGSRQAAAATAKSKAAMPPKVSGSCALMP